MHGETELYDLGPDLLACICQAVGARDLSYSHGVSSKLHRAWQTIITRLLCNNLLTDKDIQTIKKYTKLKTLRLGTRPGPIEQGPGHPVWHSVRELAASLVRLLALEIYSEDVSCYQVLRTVVEIDSLRSRLERLSITSIRDRCSSGSLLRIIDDDDMHALSTLKQLKSLHLEYKKLQVSQQVLQAASQQLLGLTQLSLNSHDDEDDIMACTPAQMAAFPGSLTNLISLNLHDNWKEDDVFDLIEVSEQRQEQLVAAVSALGGLQRLATSYPLETAEAQRQALGALTQLTYLDLSYSPALCEFEALPQLPALQQLVLADDYEVPAPAAFAHSSLQELRAGGLSGLAEGASAADCGITKLRLVYSGLKNDSLLQHLPRLPKLQSLTLAYLYAMEGSYAHLASFLERQADTLLSLKLQLDSPFEEMLPSGLSQCTELHLMGSSASMRTLQLLGQAGLPRLRDLALAVSEELVGSGDAAQDVRWLHECEGLEFVRVDLVVGDGGVQEAQAQVQEALVDAARQLPKIKGLCWGQQRQDACIGDDY